MISRNLKFLNVNSIFFHQKVVELNDTILQIGQQFASGCHQQRTVRKMDLPNHIRHSFNITGDRVTLNGLPVDSPFDLAREAGYKIYYWNDFHQENLLSEMIRLRHDLASLCGYDTYAHRAMSESLGESPVKVKNFLEGLSKVSIQFTIFHLFIMFSLFKFYTFLALLFLENIRSIQNLVNHSSKSAKYSL